MATRPLRRKTFAAYGETVNINNVQFWFRIEFDEGYTIIFGKHSLGHYLPFVLSKYSDEDNYKISFEDLQLDRIGLDDFYNWKNIIERIISIADFYELSHAIKEDEK